MAISTQWVKYGNGLGRAGFLAWPERAVPTTTATTTTTTASAATTPPLPGLLVVQEAWGVDAHIEDVTRRFAGAGYVALAPDLYAEESAGGARPPALAPPRLAELLAFVNLMPGTAWLNPIERGKALAAHPEAERARIEQAMAALGLGTQGPSGPEWQRLQLARLGALEDAYRFLRDEHPATRGQRVGCVGFCMGGALGALLACNAPDLGGLVVFYGASPPADRAAAIRCPVLGHYGALDARITDGVPAFADAMRAAGRRFEPHVYDGAGHAFFNDGRPSYDARAARAAFARTAAFLAETLG